MIQMKVMRKACTTTALNKRSSLSAKVKPMGFIEDESARSTKVSLFVEITYAVT